MRIALGLVVLACLVAGPGAARADHTPGVYVSLTCPAVADQAERLEHVDHVRARLRNHAALADKQVDVNVTRLAWVVNGNAIEVQAELRLVVSTGNEIVSIANQTAKLVMSKGQFRLAKLPALRREALDTAIGDLLVKLRRASARAV